MASTRSRLPWGTIGIISALVALGLFSFFKPKIQFSNVESRNRPDFEFKEVQVTQYMMDQPEFDIHAENASVDRDSNRIDLYQMNGRLYSAAGESLGIESPTASISVSGSKIEIQNAVLAVVVGAHPATIQTKKLAWNGESGSIVCLGGIEMRTEQYRIQGDEFYGTIPIRKFRIDKNAHAEFIF